MKKYNSVFTLAFSVEHDLIDGADLNDYIMAGAIQKRLKNLLNMEELCEAVGGPDDTVENDTHPARCPDCGRTDQIQVLGEVWLDVNSQPGDEIEAVLPSYWHQVEIDYHPCSQTTCNACGYTGDLGTFTKDPSKS